MNSHNLSEMVGGWFVGNFEPSVFKTDAFEVAVKTYSAGDKEESHHHKIAFEITVIVSGLVQMNERIWKTGDIITISPGESTDFFAIEDTTTVVVKSPSVMGDKYINED